MLSKFPELFDYTFHFNREMITKIIDNQSVLPERAFQLIYHTLNAHQVWNSRILNDDKPFGVWEIHSMSELEKINETNYKKALFILENIDIKQTLKYKNSVGEAFENTIEDILFHIINHSTYHRGQLMMIFRESGIEPILADYIFYKRT